MRKPCGFHCSWSAFFGLSGHVNTLDLQQRESNKNVASRCRHVAHQEQSQALPWTLAEEDRKLRVGELAHRTKSQPLTWSEGLIVKIQTSPSERAPCTTININARLFTLPTIYPFLIVHLFPFVDAPFLLESRPQISFLFPP